MVYPIACLDRLELRANRHATQVEHVIYTRTTHNWLGEYPCRGLMVR